LVRILATFAHKFGTLQKSVPLILGHARRKGIKDDVWRIIGGV
jgi:hypothetical protein